MNFQEEAWLELTVLCAIDSTVVAASQKRFFKFYHLTLWKTRAVFLLLPFMTDVAVAVVLNYTKNRRHNKEVSCSVNGRRDAVLENETVKQSVSA